MNQLPEQLAISIRANHYRSDLEGSKRVIDAIRAAIVEMYSNHTVEIDIGQQTIDVFADGVGKQYIFGREVSDWILKQTQSFESKEFGFIARAV